MNAQAGLPTALAERQRRYTVSEDATQGLGISRGAHISIRAARFRLIDANGAETLIPNLYLDVVIIRANPKTSKLYFGGAYVQDSGEPPTCFSDNGIGPSSNALQPQSPTCVSCPHNQMNSKINPQTGKGSKACSDRKKVACIIPGDPAVNVYELQIPPDSLSGLKAYSAFLSSQATGGQRKVDISDMITRLSFDPEASHPRLKFEPVGWADDTYTLQMIDYIYDQQLDVPVVGLNDVPADPEIVKQAQQLRGSAAQLHDSAFKPQIAAAPQFQLPARGPVGMEAGAVQPHQQIQSGLTSPNTYSQEPAPAKPRGRPPKNAAPQQPTPQFQPSATPTAQPGAITQATPVNSGAQMPDIPDFLRRPNGAPAAPPVPQGAPSPQPPGLSPQFGMAGAPPPPANVSAALDAAMRMPPRR